MASAALDRFADLLAASRGSALNSGICGLSSFRFLLQHASKAPTYLFYIYMGGCQNYGAFLSTLIIRCRIKRDHNFDNHPYDVVDSIFFCIIPIWLDLQFRAPKCSLGPSRKNDGESTG